MDATIVLITGANSGVGLGIAQVLSSVLLPTSTGSRPYHVIMTGRSLAKVEAARATLLETGDESMISTLELDVTSPDSINAAAATVKERWGKLDVLISNAGIYTRDSDPPTNDLAAELTKSFLTNVTGPALITQAFTPLIVAAAAASWSEAPTVGAKGQYVLFVSSGLGSMQEAADPTRRNYYLGAIGYRASKAALNMLAVQTHRVLGPQDIKVFTVCPGLVKSKLRGESEVEITAGGRARDPLESGRLILSILRGERDADVGKFVHAGGLYGW